MRRRCLLLMLALCLSAWRLLPAAVLTPGFLETTNILPGVSLITDIEFSPDESQRLFIAEQRGTIRIVKQGVLLPDPFLTIDPPPHALSECGLLGLCFD